MAVRADRTWYTESTKSSIVRFHLSVIQLDWQAKENLQTQEVTSLLSETTVTKKEVGYQVTLTHTQKSLLERISPHHNFL